MPRFAANLAYLFTERPLPERIGAAKAAGFGAVEFQMPYDHAPGVLKAEIERHGVAVLGLNTALGRPGEAGLAAVPGRQEEFKALFRQALDYAVAIGGNAVHCLAGLVPPEQRPAADPVFVANLARAADAAGEKGVKLLIEPLNARDRPGYFLSRVEHAADVIARCGRPNVRLQFDCYHVQITHVQVAAVPSRQEPDEGEINYPAIYAALDRVGYDGWVSCEYKPRARTEDGLGWGKAWGIGKSE
jgi:hydroxypyruvate isomerase